MLLGRGVLIITRITHNIFLLSVLSLPVMWWGFIGSLDMLEYEAMRSLMSSQGVALFWDILDLSRPWESLDDIQKRLSHWLINQHWARWHDLGNTQRQARELISGCSLGAKAKFLSFNRTQSRVVTGLLTEHGCDWPSY